MSRDVHFQKIRAVLFQGLCHPKKLNECSFCSGKNLALEALDKLEQELVALAEERDALAEECVRWRDESTRLRAGAE